MATEQKINFATVKAAAAKYTEDQLVFAINDCLETIQLQENCGIDVTKYYDQISVYRPALAKLRKGKKAASSQTRKCKNCFATITTNIAETKYCYSCGNKI